MSGTQLSPSMQRTYDWLLTLNGEWNQPAPWSKTSMATYRALERRGLIDIESVVVMQHTRTGRVTYNWRARARVQQPVS